MGLIWLMLLVVVVAMLLGWVRTGGAGGSDAPSAREILDRRYARGEISREEYQQRLDDLRR